MRQTRARRKPLNHLQMRRRLVLTWGDGFGPQPRVSFHGKDKVTERWMVLSRKHFNQKCYAKCGMTMRTQKKSEIRVLGKDRWYIDWCCCYYFVRNSLVHFLEALCTRIWSLDSWISVFSWHFCFVGCCCKVLTESFSRLCQPGSCVWWSPYLLCADCTCVLLCHGVYLCMCMWKCVGKVMNIQQIYSKPWPRHVL